MPQKIIAIFLAVILIGAASPASAAGLLFTNKTPTDGLGSAIVYAVSVDRDMLYAATRGGLSISTNAGGRFINLTTSDGLPSNLVLDVYASNGNVYAGTSNGLAISTNRGVSFTRKTVADGLGDNFIWRVYADGNNIYAATDKGLSISTDGGVHFTNKTTTQGLGHHTVNDLYVDGATIYAATAAGLSISTDGGAHFINRTTADGLGNNIVSGVYASQGTLYAATAGGLSISTDGGLRFVNRTTANGLGSNLVRKVYAEGPIVYAATAGGLSISSDGGATFTNKTTVDGLGSNSILSVTVSGGAIYAALNGGLSIARISISGKLGVPGATLRYYDGGPRTAVSDSSGSYTLEVSYHWSGVVTASQAGYVFSPASRSYAEVVSSRAGQDYAATPNLAEPTVQDSDPDATPIVLLACGIEAGDCDQLYDHKKLPLRPYMAWSARRGYETHLIGIDKYSQGAANGPAKIEMALAILDDIKNSPGDIYLVGHSAGADAIIIAVDMALSEGWGHKIAGLVLLDPYFESNGFSLQRQADRISAGLPDRVFLGKSIGDTVSIQGATTQQYRVEHRPLSYNEDVLKDILRMLPGWK